MLRVRITFPISEERLINAVNNDRVRLYLARTAYKYMYEYIPIYTGALANTVDITKDGILFKQDYSETLYKDPWNLHTEPGSHTEYRKAASKLGRTPSWTPYYHPKATHFWDETMMNDHRDDIIRDLKRYIEGRANE